MRSFYDFVIAIGEEAYLDRMSTAYVVREGLDVDEELDLSDSGEVDADGDAVIPEPVPEGPHRQARRTQPSEHWRP